LEGRQLGCQEGKMAGFLSLRGAKRRGSPQQIATLKLAMTGFLSLRGAKWLGDEVIQPFIIKIKISKAGSPRKSKIFSR